MRTDRDDELEREIRLHLELDADERMADGLSGTDARVAARRAFGHVPAIRQDVRAVWTPAWRDGLVADVRHMLRSLRRHPGFALVAILTLALGIGANTAIFSLVHAVWLRPLPFTDPDRLVVIWEDMSKRGGPSTVEAAPASFVDWKAQSGAFEDMAAVNGVLVAFNLTGRGDAERLSGAEVTANLFPLLGLQPIAGRTFVPDDDRPGATPVAVISEGLWSRRFGASRTLVGQSISLNDVPHTVVGIVAGHFQFPTRGTEVWVAAQFTPEELAARANYYLNVIARMKPGVSLAQAQADMDVVARRQEEANPRGRARVGALVRPLHEQYSATAGPTLRVLLATVGVVLLIACVNVAHLLLARGADRRKELALRGALGANRWRLIRQLLTESLVLAGVGAAAGTVLSMATFGFLVRLIPANFPADMALGLDPAVLFFTAGVAGLVSIGFGAGPAIAGSRVSVHGELRQSAPSAGSRRDRTVRGALVVAEVAMCVVLLVAAGLLVRSYVELTAVNPGFAAGEILVAETPLSPSRYGQPQRRVDFLSRAIERAQALPGVVSAAYINYIPVAFKGGKMGFGIEGRPDPAPDQLPLQIASDRVVTPDYFRTMGIPLVRGRMFDDRDGADAPRTILINETMARAFWGADDPIGRRIAIGAGRRQLLTIVGIVRDVRQMGLDVPPDAEFYFPAAQMGQSPPFFWPRYLVVRTAGEPLALAQAVRNAIASIDPDQPVTLRSMPQVIAQDLAGRSTQLTLVGAFSLLALLLAAVGLYGVLAYTVARQTAEIGLRVALGATSAELVVGVIRRTLGLTGIGIVIGLATASAVTRMLSSFLYAVSPTDPVAFASVALLLLVVAVVAGYLPARRATQVNPMEALRTE